MLNIIVPAVLTAITLIMAYISYKFPFNTKNGKTTKAARFFGILVTLSIIGLGYIVYVSINLDKESALQKQKDKAHSDSVINNVTTKLGQNVDSALKAHGMSYNSVTKTVTVIDTTQRKPIDPVMDFVTDSIMVKGTLKKPYISVFFITVNAGIAYNPRCELLIFKIYNGKVINQGDVIKADNALIKSYGTKGYTCGISIAMPTAKPLTTDTNYIFFKAFYSNKQVGGQDQQPLRGLFYTIVDSIPKKVSDVKIHTVDETGIRHSLQNALVKSKYW